MIIYLYNKWEFAIFCRKSLFTFCVKRYIIMSTEPAEPLDALASMRIMAGLLFYVGDYMAQNINIKPFKTYDEQLALLKQRGMHVSNDALALAMLKTENYYRLSGYWLTMLKKNSDGTEAFYPSANFDNVINLYRFDAELRKVIMSATITIETNLKAFVAYYHGQKYGPCGYTNSANAEDFWNHALFINALSGDLRKRREEPFVKHHDTDLGGVYPIWVVTEVCSFDQISKFYRNMLPTDRSKIAKDFYGIASREHIESWLHCAVVARNMAAHGARFYNKPNFKPAALLPKHLKPHAASLFGYIYAIYHLLPRCEQMNFIDSVSRVIEGHSFALIRYLGFPEGWKSLIIQGAQNKALPAYTPEVHTDVNRYLEYGWEWRVIATMINRVYGYSFTPTQIKELHAVNSK